MIKNLPINVPKCCFFCEDYIENTGKSVMVGMVEEGGGLESVPGCHSDQTFTIPEDAYIKNWDCPYQMEKLLNR